MHIAVFSFEFPPLTAFGGIATYSEQLADMLSDAGHLVEVFAGGNSDSLVVRTSGVRVHHCGLMAFSERAAGKLLDLHLQHPFDLIESPEYRAEALTAIRLIPELPLVIRMHTPMALLARINTPRNQWRLPVVNLLKQTKAILSQWRNGEPLSSLHFAHPALRDSIHSDHLEALQARAADMICSPSKALVPYAAEHWGTSPAKARHLPNLFKAPQALTSLPPEGRPKCLGFFGRLEDRKGLNALIAALPLIAKAIPDFELCCVGQATHLLSHNAMADEVLRRRCKALGIQLHLPGKVSRTEIAAWYGKCQVVALPSVWENFPYTCLEAMAAGCAVIGSDAGGMSDMISPGETGLLVPPHAPAQLAESCISLLQSPDRCVQLGTRARAHVLSTYAPEVLCKHYLATYEEAIRLRNGVKRGEN